MAAEAARMFAEAREAGEAPAFRPGDVVRLRSGGPAMTVTNVTPGDWVQCLWMTEGGEVRERSLLPLVLEPWEPEIVPC